MCNDVFYGPHLPPKSCVTAKPVNIKPVVLLCYETQAQSGGSAASVSVPDTMGHPRGSSSIAQQVRAFLEALMFWLICVNVTCVWKCFRTINCLPGRSFALCLAL